MTTLGLSADALLSTTRAVRRRLDFERPVDDDLIRECLEFAVQAPTGSNQQGWRFLVVTDPDKKAALADLYRRGWAVYTGMSASAGALAVGAEGEVLPSNCGCCGRPRTWPRTCTGSRPCSSRAFTDA